MDEQPIPSITTSDNAKESAQVAHLKFRLKSLNAKRDALNGHKSSPGHDIQGAKDRTDIHIAQLEDELKKAQSS